MHKRQDLERKVGRILKGLKPEDDSTECDERLWLWKDRLNFIRQYINDSKLNSIELESIYKKIEEAEESQNLKNKGF